MFSVEEFTSKTFDQLNSQKQLFSESSSNIINNCENLQKNIVLCSYNLNQTDFMMCIIYSPRHLKKNPLRFIYCPSEVRYWQSNWWNFHGRDLGQNYLTGSIPAFLGNLTRLQYLWDSPPFCSMFFSRNFSFSSVT